MSTKVEKDPWPNTWNQYLATITGRNFPFSVIEYGSMAVIRRKYRTNLIVRLANLVIFSHGWALHYFSVRYSQAIWRTNWAAKF